MKKILIRTKEKTFCIAAHEILYCQAARAYSVIYMFDGQAIVASVNLLRLYERMKDLKCILRVSQSFLINIHFVKSIHHTTKEIELQTNVMIPFTIAFREIEHALINNSEDQPKN